MPAPTFGTTVTVAVWLEVLEQPVPLSVMETKETVVVAVIAGNWKVPGVGIIWGDCGTVFTS